MGLCPYYIKLSKDEKIDITEFGMIPIERYETYSEDKHEDFCSLCKEVTGISFYTVEEDCPCHLLKEERIVEMCNIWLDKNGQ
jgi:hypothetical protein